MATRKVFLVSLLTICPVLAQVPDAPAPAPAPPASQPIGGGGDAPIGQPASARPAAKPANNNPLGQEVPVFDPSTEVLTFNGKNWNVTNNRVFQARFEKFLNAPEASSADDQTYRAYIERILDLLRPGNATQQNVDAAFKLLPYASRFDFDGRLCDSLGDAVYSVWQAQRNQARLVAANEALEEASKKLEWNLQVVTSDRKLVAPPKTTGGGGGNGNGGGRGGRGNGGGGNGGGGNVNPATSSDYETLGYSRQLAERLAAIKANQVKRELSELQAKVEFQALMVQFLMQRRFQHVLMATRFYRALFTDGDTKLNLSKDAADLFAKSTGMPPTVSLVDSMANEVVRDVNEGVKAFQFLLEQGELDGATKRLQETFVSGEYMPAVRLIAREKKRKCLEYSQKGFQLISAVDTRYFSRAETLIADMKKMAKDFDDTKPSQLINVAKLKQRGLLALARQAALTGDTNKTATLMADAAAEWPDSTEYKDASESLFKQGNTVLQTLVEFDQLLSQKNYRQIWDFKGRFIAAASTDAARQKSLDTVLTNMQKVEASVLRAEEMARQGAFAGAWETLERSWAEFPDDPKLNQLRADMTTRASDFVRVIRDAENLEKKEQYGSSLSHFLKARKLYPASDFAREGVDRLVKQVLPGA